MVLIDHMISTHDVTSPIECSFFCAANDKCKSYNYKPRGAGDQDVCQLNNATRQTNPASYKVDVAFVHYFDESEVNVHVKHVMKTTELLLKYITKTLLMQVYFSCVLLDVQVLSRLFP